VVVFFANKALDNERSILINRVQRNRKNNFGPLQQQKIGINYIILTFLMLGQDQSHCAGKAKNNEDGDNAGRHAAIKP
jgi:hypothetical protein